jgi:MFS transporter, DHA2 family, multidrug resistance protein
LLILGPRVLPEYRDVNAGRLDLLSAGMSITAVLAVVYGLKEVASTGLGATPLVAIAVGLGIGAAFVRRQLRLDDPMIDIRLFAIRAFNAALAVNFLAIFVAVGYFLFIAQYLQLVSEMSPLEAGLWSLPSALGFIAGSQLAPRIVDRIPPHVLIGGGLGVAALGLLLLTQVAASSGVSTLIASSVIISLGLAPVFGLTTELIVGSAPTEKAGAASGISETSAELGGALGIAILGSVGVAIYRGRLNADIPAAVPAEAATAARDTLGAAGSVAEQLPEPVAAALLDAARAAFVDGMHLTAGIAAILAFAIAALAYAALRGHGSAANETEPDETRRQVDCRGQECLDPA